MAEEAKPPPPAAAPPVVAPPPPEVPVFEFEGGKAVNSESDPVQLYKGYMEYVLRSKWNRPDNMDDDHYVAEVQVHVDKAGQLGRRRSGRKAPATTNGTRASRTCSRR